MFLALLLIVGLAVGLGALIFWPEIQRSSFWK